MRLTTLSAGLIAAACAWPALGQDNSANSDASSSNGASRQPQLWETNTAQAQPDSSAQSQPDAAAQPSGPSSDASGTAAPPPSDQPAPATAQQPTGTVPVNAPAEAPATKGETSADLGTIEVTAQRRKEKMQDVPVAVTAITQDQVEARGISRLDDLNSLAPGLQVSRSPSDTTITQLTIRGSSQINPAIYWDPSVGVYLDGVYIGKGQGAIFDVVDLQGVEVLRGPQGTLYGRNTIAGTINLVSREPSGNFNGNVGVEYGRFNDQVYKASVDLPRFSMADVTVGVRSERRDPWISTTPTSPVDGMNDRHEDGAHLGALLDFGDWVSGLSAMYHLDWSDTDQTNNFLQLYRYDDASGCGTPANPCMAPYVSRERRNTADINAPTGELAKVLGHSLILTWDVSDLLTVKSITGYRKVRWLDKLDLDGSPNDVAHSMRDTHYDQTSQDLNFSGQWSALHYTAGAYYFTDDGFTNNPIHVLVSGANIDFDSRYGTHSKAYAGYGQLDWKPLDPLTVSGGARYTTEKKDLDRVYGFRTFQPGLPPPPYTYYMPEGYKAPGATFTDTSPMGSVAWRFTDWLNTYVRYAAGFKSGGFNGEYSNITGTQQEHQTETNTPFRPEKQKSLEAGAKTTFLGGKALANIAVFHNKLDDLQVSIFTAGGAAASVIRNAGKATVDGAELETAFIPFEGTTLRLNYAYLKPKYDVFTDAVCNDTGPQPTNCENENVANNRAFVHAPQNAYNAVIDSDLWHTAWGTVHANLDYAWTDSFYTYPYQLTGPSDPLCQGSNGGPRPCYDNTKQSAPNSQVPAYGILNAKLSMDAIPLGGSRLGQVALWGRNVLDENSVNNFIDFGPGFNNLTVANFVEPAAYGIAATFQW